MNERLNWSEYVALIYPFPLPKKYIFLPVQKHILHVEPVSDVLVICGGGLFVFNTVKSPCSDLICRQLLSSAG